MSATDDTPPARPPSYFSSGWFRTGSDEPQLRIKARFQFEFIDPGRATTPRWPASYAGGWEIASGAVEDLIAFTPDPSCPPAPRRETATKLPAASASAATGSTSPQPLGRHWRHYRKRASSPLNCLRLSSLPNAAAPTHNHADVA